MDNNLLWQYIAVAILIILAMVRMIGGLRRRSKKRGSCGGCSLADTCHDYKRPPKHARKTLKSDQSSKKCDCCK